MRRHVRGDALRSAYSGGGPRSPRGLGYPARVPLIELLTSADRALAEAVGATAQPPP